MCSGKCTRSTYSPGTRGLLSPCLLWGRCLSVSLLLPPCFYLLQPLLSLCLFGLFSLRSRWHIFVYLALSTKVLSLLRVLQIFSFSFKKTQCRHWKFRSMTLTADLLRLLEAMVSFEDRLLFLSASAPITSCSFQLHGVQLSWIFLGCLRRKRKQRPYFLVTLFCLAVLQRWGVTSWAFSIASCWPRKALEQQEEVFGLCRSPISSLIPKRNNWVYAGRE